MEEDNENLGNWEDNPALIKLFSEMDLDEYLQGFRLGYPLSQQEIEFLELRGKYLTELGKNKELYGKWRESQNLVRDLKKNKTIETRHKKSLENLRPQYDFGKLPPQNIALEEIVLGSYINFPKLMNQGKFSQPYVNLMWYKENHLKIHSVLMNTSRKITPQVVISELRRINVLDDIGGIQRINQLVENKEITNDVSTIEMYLEELEFHYGKRNLIRFATELMNLGFDGNKIESVPETIREQSAKLLELLPFRYRQTHDKKSAIVQVKEDLKELEKRKGLPRISTGFRKLDAVTHGVLPGKLFINGARGKMGKTAFTTSLAENVASQGYDVAYFSHEVPLKEMINRLTSRRTGISFGRFEYNPQGFTKEEEIKINNAHDEIEKSLLHLEPGRASSLDYIVCRSKQLKMSYPDLSLIVFDGLQAYENLVPDRGNKSDFFTKIMSTMKYEIAEPLGVSIFLNAQLKSDVDVRYKKSLGKPRSSEDFSDCKGIKDICDGAFGLWRGEYYLPENENYKNKLKIIPLDLRSEDKNAPPFDIGCDMKTMNVYEI